MVKTRCSPLASLSRCGLIPYREANSDQNASWTPAGRFPSLWKSGITNTTIVLCWLLCQDGKPTWPSGGEVSWGKTVELRLGKSHFSKCQLREAGRSADIGQLIRHQAARNTAQRAAQFRDFARVRDLSMNGAHSRQNRSRISPKRPAIDRNKPVIEKCDSGTHLAHKTASEKESLRVFENLPLIEQISERPSRNSKVLNGVKNEIQQDSTRYLIAQQHIYKDGPRFRASKRETLREAI